MGASSEERTLGRRRAIPRSGKKDWAWARQVSMTSPARTPEGQAVVQARQSRQKKASSCTAGVNSSLRSATARARATRPRGLERSRPVRA